MNAPSKIEPATLHTAMAAAFAEIEGATKSANNPHFKTKYADLTAVIEAIKPALVNNGLFFTQHPQPSENGITVETVLHHAGGECLPLGTLYVPANKNDAQAYGSALTYARRYALVTAFGVPVEDDDGNAARAGGQIQKGTVSPPPVISNEQCVMLQSLMQATKANPVGFNQFFGIADLSKLPAPRFDEAKAMLDKKLADLVQAETNEKAGFGKVLEDEIPY